MDEHEAGTPGLQPMPDDWQRALAVVAHPDDMEYGMAAAVAEWTAGGKAVAYLLATRGEAGIDNLEPAESARVRETEQRASAQTVGVSDIEYLDHLDGVIEEGVGLRRDIAAVLRRRRPELVVTINHRATWGLHGWNTPDHRAVGRAVLDAAGDAGNRWIFPEQLADEGTAPWDGVRWVGVAGTSAPTHAVAVGPESVERAVASLAEHRAYISALSDAAPEEYARSVVAGSVLTDGGRHVRLELFPR